MSSLSSQGLETAELNLSVAVYDGKTLTVSNKTALLLLRVGNLIQELLLVWSKCLNPQVQSKGFRLAQGMLPSLSIAVYNTRIQSNIVL